MIKLALGYPQYYATKDRTAFYFAINDEGLDLMPSRLGTGDYEEISGEEAQEIADYVILNHIYRYREAFANGFIFRMKGGSDEDKA